MAKRTQQPRPADDASSASPPPLDELKDLVPTAWKDTGDYSAQTLGRSGETWTRFLTRQQKLGAVTPADFTLQHCRDFVWAYSANGQPAEIATMHARRTALRMGFRALRDLGHDVGDPTLDLVLPPRTGTTARPLTDAEAGFCRTSARLGEAGAASLQRAVAWAIGETTAVSSEISAVRVRDVDDHNDPRWIRLPGTRRHDARLGELTDWGSTIVKRQLQLFDERNAPPSTPLTYKGGAEPGQAKAQAAVCNALGAVLKFAGLAAEPDVRPASLRNWAGWRLFHGGMPIEHVARRMGSRSLDAAAEDIGLVWRNA